MGVFVVFETATPFDTPRKIRELVEWFDGAVRTNQHHSLILIAVFVVNFLAIHPFQDGNGRLSRILTTLCLLKAGYLYVPYSSLERIIEENKDRYYLALRRAQSTLYADNARLGDWLTFFLQSLKTQTDSMLRKLEHEKSLLEVPKLSQDILAFAREHGRMTVRDICKLTGANRNTIKVHLKGLVKKRLLVLAGTGKGAWYRRSIVEWQKPDTGSGVRADAVSTNDSPAVRPQPETKSEPPGVPVTPERNS